MRILQSHQYNQGIGKYKLLSSTAGVGSIITTKFGTYVLISDINKWRFIFILNNNIKSLLERPLNNKYVAINREARNLGLSLVDDIRFIKFIKNEKELKSLECLIAIPQMAINENFNSIMWLKKIHGRIEPAHPIASALMEMTGKPGRAEDYQIQSTHFPKWFKNDKGELKKISEWLEIWKENGNAINTFSPPRDATAPIKGSNREQIKVTFKNTNNRKISIPLFKELSQTNLILICPNGHLSDIPWSKYLNWKTQKENFELKQNNSGSDLFDIDSCCSNSNLKWTESKTKSEGYGSIYLECTNCGLGSGNSKEKPKITLEGINSLTPNCYGQKPWEVDLNNPDFLPFEKCYKKDGENYEREKMRVSLVTANNTYYSNGFSSLFIPMHLAEEKSEELWGAIDRLNKKYESAYNRALSQNRTPRTKLEYWEAFDAEGFIYDDEGLNPTNYKKFENNLKTEFLSELEEEKEVDFHESYRCQEYKCFSQNGSFNGEGNSKGLSFKSIKLNDDLRKFFQRIQQIDELKVTNVQFDFTRVKPKERIAKINEVGEKEIIESTTGQNIFSIEKDELYVLPANETLGEGIFFQFDDNKINEWIEKNSDSLQKRFGHLINREIDIKQQGANSMQKIKNNGFKHFLIHSFSHMLMRELEFSCGYPTASLKERLYISTSQETQMSGVLIYTAEGSEGSMGGLVSQGEPEKILEIIKNGLYRSNDCSSDPLCWESDGQGIFNLNMSACFSCSLVAETACEEMNLGLDRRVLIDSEFGYFKKIITNNLGL